MAILVNEEPITHQGVTPTAKDVLLGKGTPINNHEGNKNFRRLIKLNHTKYDNEAEGNKFLVARAIVDSLYNDGCRFLKKSDDGVWQEVEKKRAYAKAQQTLRDGAPKRREKKYRIFQEKLQRDKQQDTQKTPLPQPSSLRASTPLPQDPMPVTAPVVSPVASPTVELSATVSRPSSTAAAPEDSHGSSSHHDFPSNCVLDSWPKEIDDTSASEEELEAIVLKPDAVLDGLVDNDQPQGEQQPETDNLFSFDGIESLLINDSDSDDEDWFDHIPPIYFA